jgi:hypothetical protein
MKLRATLGDYERKRSQRDECSQMIPRNYWEPAICLSTSDACLSLAKRDYTV